MALKDTGDQATAVYLARNLPEPGHDDALGLLLKTPGVDHHVWRPGDGLPEAVAVLRSSADTSAGGIVQ